MYDDLVRRLRYCSEEQNGCGMCALSSDCVLRVGLLTQAADAIEELNLIAESNGRSAKRWAETAELAVEQIPRWVSVTERLPEERDYYLAMTEDCEVWVCEFLPGVKQWWIVPSDDLILSVTHWQKLPEPLKEEEE